MKITGGLAVGKEIVVADELVIGREAPGDGKLDADPELSRQHARIGRKGAETWEIEDLGSRNGTFVNGSKIEKPELLAAGDQIEMGGTKLVVQVSAPVTPAEPQPTPPPPSTVVGDAVADETADETADEAAALQPEPTQPPVSLAVEIDVAAGEALISLADGSDRVKLVFEDGAWRLRPEA